MADRPTVAAALATIRHALRPLGSEVVPLGEAVGRIATTPSYARHDVPGFAASAMDGFALRAADAALADEGAPVSLRLGGDVAAGRWPPPLAAGEAVPISTGAPLPAGADTVEVRELAEIAGGRLSLRRSPVPGRNVRSIGEDAAAGEEVITAGTRLGADAIGALAAYGVAQVAVACVPRLALASTGSELVGPGEDRAAAALVDSNAPMIAAFAQEAGLPCRFVGRAQDSPAALERLLRDATAPGGADLVVSTGGVSGGAHDLVRATLEHLGATILFHGVQMRPGKPLLFATLADGRPFFGLPGNPVAALVGMRFFVAAAIRALLGLPAEEGEPAPHAIGGRPGTTLFLRGRHAADGGVDVTLDQRSHVLRSVLAADCWVRVDDGGARVFAKAPPLR